MAWTEEMVEQLRQMWMQGLTANEIAKKLNVSKNSIVGKVHRLCLKARPSPIKKKESEETEKASAEIVAEVSEKISKVATTEVKTVAKTAPNKECNSGNLKLVQLDSHTCRWPLGDPRDEDFCFCGKKVKTGQTYCDEHSMIAYVKALKK